MGKNYRTVVEVKLQRVDKDGNPVDSQGRVYDSSIENWQPAEDPVLFYLLHWGLAYDLYRADDKYIPVNYTVAICEQIDTGVIRKFLPEQLKVIGFEAK